MFKIELLASFIISFFLSRNFRQMVNDPYRFYRTKTPNQNFRSFFYNIGQREDPGDEVDKWYKGCFKTATFVAESQTFLLAKRPQRRGLRERTLGTRLEKHHGLSRALTGSHGLDSTPRRHFGCELDRLPILTVLDKVPGC